VSTLHEYDARAEAEDPLTRGPHFVDRRVRHPGQRFSLRDVGRQHAGVRQKLTPDRVHGISLEEPIAAFRDHDGIVVIEHDGGWTSLLIEMSPRVERGARVAAGDPIGRALGDLQLELRHDGQPVSAALIAGSSRLLFNRSRLR
jgi:hypothetical protein